MSELDNTIDAHVIAKEMRDNYERFNMAYLSLPKDLREYFDQEYSYRDAPAYGPILHLGMAVDSFADTLGVDYD